MEQVKKDLYEVSKSRAKYDNLLQEAQLKENQGKASRYFAAMQDCT